MFEHQYPQVGRIDLPPQVCRIELDQTFRDHEGDDRRLMESDMEREQEEIENLLAAFHALYTIAKLHGVKDRFMKSIKRAYE